MDIRLRLVAGIALLLVSVAAGGYSYPVHFYTTALVAGKLQLNTDEWKLLTLCTQLPDESQELDAITVRRTLPLGESLITWGMLSRRNSASARRMITIHQVLHGLTGGDADMLNVAARRIVGTLWDAVASVTVTGEVPATNEERATRICALGFALHLLGDSFAHRNLNEDERDRMYGTGRGHFIHGTVPDHVLRSRTDPSAYGLGYWKGYVETILELAGNGPVLDTELQAAYDGLGEIRDDSWWRQNQQASDYLLQLGDADKLGPDWRPELHDKRDRCQAYLARLQRNRRSQDPPLPPYCQDVWDEYLRVAAPVFVAGGEALRDYSDVGGPQLAFVGPDF